MAELQYQRLTRARARTGVGLIVPFRSSLWIGADHLLRLDSSGFAETYKRFYFRDIQAIVIRQTDQWKILGGLCATIGAVMIVLAFVSMIGGSTVGAWIYGALAGCFLLISILTFAGGPSCTCQIRTAVQTEDLPPLNTVRRARKALEELRPLIVAAQGQLSSEQIQARLGSSRQTAPPASLSDRSGSSDQNLPPVIRPDA